MQLVSLTLLVALTLAAQDPESSQGPVQRPTPPAQPAEGPGGAEYTHGGMRRSEHGSGATGYFLFEPTNPAPTEPVPLVVFLHGWTATRPEPYVGWIKHLVRRGNVVVYPRYQRLTSMPDTFTPSAVKAVRASLIELARPDRVSVDRERVAYLGHSMGGLVSANLASVAKDEGLPVPKALFPIQPGRTRNHNGGPLAPLYDLSKVPAETLVVVLVGDDDSVCGDHDGRRIWRETTAVPDANKDFVILRSDRTGAPELRAHHFAPLAWDLKLGDPSKLGIKVRASVDALDWYGLWRPFDALCAAAFGEGPRKLALGDGKERTFMGHWSDGREVVRLSVE